MFDVLDHPGEFWSDRNKNDLIERATLADLTPSILRGILVNIEVRCTLSIFCLVLSVIMGGRFSAVLVS